MVYNHVRYHIKGVVDMLFKKKMERSCSYCSLATTLPNGEILCIKRGVVSPDIKCRKFKYDPCKRIPPRPKALDFDKYQQEDFSL